MIDTLDNTNSQISVSKDRATQETKYLNSILWRDCTNVWSFLFGSGII